MTILNQVREKGSVKEEIAAKVHWFNRMSKQGIINVNRLAEAPPKSMYSSPENSPYRIEHDEDLMILNEQQLKDLAEGKYSNEQS